MFRRLAAVFTALATILAGLALGTAPPAGADPIAYCGFPSSGSFDVDGHVGGPADNEIRLRIRGSATCAELDVSGNTGAAAVNRLAGWVQRQADSFRPGRTLDRNVYIVIVQEDYDLSTDPGWHPNCGPAGTTLASTGSRALTCGPTGVAFFPPDPLPHELMHELGHLVNAWGMSTLEADAAVAMYNGRDEALLDELGLGYADSSAAEYVAELFAMQRGCAVLVGEVPGPYGAQRQWFTTDPRPHASARAWDVDDDMGNLLDAIVAPDAEALCEAPYWDDIGGAFDDRYLDGTVRSAVCVDKALELYRAERDDGFGGDPNQHTAREIAAFAEYYRHHDEPGSDHGISFGTGDHTCSEVNYHNVGTGEHGDRTQHCILLAQAPDDGALFGSGAIFTSAATLDACGARSSVPGGGMPAPYEHAGRVPN